MIGRFRVENPDLIEFSLDITATAKEWCELRDQLKNIWPSSKLSSMITDVLSQTRKIFYQLKDVG